MPLTKVLAVDALILLVSVLALWRLAARIGDVSFIDVWWPTGMGLTAAASFLGSRTGGARQALLLALCLLWSARLALHLHRRWRRTGPDPRYVELINDARRDRGWSFQRASLLLVFALQAPLQFVVALPVETGAFGSDRIGGLGWAGAALALFGVLFEAVADAQLEAFRRDPARRGRVLDTGLWRYSRHPNHFGEACVWWGLWLLAAAGGLAGLVSVVGPLLITGLLVKGSGAPTVDKRLARKGEAFESYRRRTSPFIPWPPRKDVGGAAASG